MTDTNTCATCDFYRASPSPGHGSCHINPPGNAVSHGFPLVAAIEWCAKGATGGKNWSGDSSKDAIIEQLVTSLQRVIVEGVIQKAIEPIKAELPLVVQLMQRNLWQRICNAVPWEGK